MKSKKTGKKDLWYKLKDVFSNLAKNSKLEIFLTISAIICMVVSERLNIVFPLLDSYFSNDRCAGIVSYLSIVIGIYVSVWSIFATSASKINEALLKGRIEGQLFCIIVLGLIESFLAIILCVFIPCTFNLYHMLLFVLVSLASISFVKFVTVLMRITKLNIQFITKEIDEGKRKSTELSIKIDEIYQATIKSKKDRTED